VVLSENCSFFSCAFNALRINGKTKRKVASIFITFFINYFT